jgi:hypothetical protein
MIFLEFPILGDMRFPLLIIEWISVIIEFEISLFFLIRYKKQEKTLKNLQDLGYFAVFFGFSLMYLFYILGDYYASDSTISPFLIWNHGSERIFFLNLGYFTALIACFILIFCVEKYNVFLYKKYFYSIIISIFALLFIIVFFIDIRLTQQLTYGFWYTFLIFFINFLIKFIKKLKFKGIFLFISTALWASGYSLTTDMFIQTFGFESRIIGASLLLISVIFLSYIFFTLTDFSEFDWKEKIEALFLIDKAGICLYHKIFNKKKELIGENLISAAISIVNEMLRDLIGTGNDKGVLIIKKPNQIVMIYSGKNLSGVLYTTEDLNYPKVILKEFVNKFELLFRNIIQDQTIKFPREKLFKYTEIITENLFY